MISVSWQQQSIDTRVNVLRTNIRACGLEMTPYLEGRIRAIACHQFGVKTEGEYSLWSARFVKPLSMFEYGPVFAIYGPKGPAYYLTVEHIDGGMKRYFTCLKIREENCHMKRGLLSLGPKLCHVAETNLLIHAKMHQMFKEFVTKPPRAIGAHPEFLLTKVEHYAGKDLHERLAGGLELEKEPFIKIASQLLSILKAFHSKGLAIADLKPPNLVQDGDRWKLVEVDDTVYFGEPTGGTQIFSAPECRRYDSEGKYLGITATPENDIHSYGCCLSQMLYRAKVEKAPWRSLIAECCALDPLARPRLLAIEMTIDSIRRLDQIRARRERK